MRPPTFSFAHTCYQSLPPDPNYIFNPSRSLLNSAPMARVARVVNRIYAAPDDSSSSSRDSSLSRPRPASSDNVDEWVYAADPNDNDHYQALSLDDVYGYEFKVRALPHSHPRSYTFCHSRDSKSGSATPMVCGTSREPRQRPRRWPLPVSCAPSALWREHSTDTHHRKTVFTTPRSGWTTIVRASRARTRRRMAISSPTRHTFAVSFLKKVTLSSRTESPESVPMSWRVNTSRQPSRIV